MGGGDREGGGRRRDARSEDGGCRDPRGDVAKEEREEDNRDPKGACSVERDSLLPSSDEEEGEPEKTRESH
ncbi:hypothetical protein NDU88_006572 [Pleurodeles waltl]|uniref:Uncharacterized protein n=1 Tax=Pleurodeles waltl TaxID=8319 RepID=A0AAV7QKF2_PLEWA|nr:hypothetical protein NDU88_006572 [Pleurodeles waltl]